MKEQKDKFQQGAYLIKNKVTGTVSKIVVLEVTKTCYRIQYENGYKRYVEKRAFDFDYVILEELKPSLKDLFTNAKRMF